MTRWPFTCRAARQACQSLLHHASMNPIQRAQAYADDLAFAKCMREHGITKYPDLHSNVVDLRHLRASSDSPQFKAAQQACRQHQIPNGKDGGGR